MTATSGSAARRARASSPWPARSTRNSAARIASSESSTRGSSSTIRIVVSSTGPPQGYARRTYLSSAGFATRRSSGRRRPGRAGPGDREPKREHRSAGGWALGPDLPAMLRDDLVADGEAEPGALADGLGGEERVEDAAKRVGCDPRAGVGDVDHRRRSLPSRLDGDRAGPRDCLGGVGEDVQEDLVDLRPDTFHRAEQSVTPDHRDPILQQVVQQGQARVELLVQVDRLPQVVRSPGEHPQGADDLAGAVGALADAGDHRIEVLERVVDLELSGLEIAVGAPQLLVGGAQLLGADAPLVLEAPRQTLDGLEALRLV